MCRVAWIEPSLRMCQVPLVEPWPTASASPTTRNASPSSRAMVLAWLLPHPAVVEGVVGAWQLIAFPPSAPIPPRELLSSSCLSDVASTCVSQGVSPGSTEEPCNSIWVGVPVCDRARPHKVGHKVDVCHPGQFTGLWCSSWSKAGCVSQLICL